MSLVQDSIYAIRGSLGDLQNTRWHDTFIISELNRAIDRMLAILKRNNLDLGKAKLSIELTAGQEKFDLPTDFRGVVGLYKEGSAINLQTVEAFETVKTTGELSMWAVHEFVGEVANAPSQDTKLTLIYWKQPPLLTQPASDMPFSGILDSALIDYVRVRLMNYDEMNTQQDTAFLQDMEDNILTLALSRNPTNLAPKGWLAG